MRNKERHQKLILPTLPPIQKKNIPTSAKPVAVPIPLPLPSIVSADVRKRNPLLKSNLFYLRPSQSVLQNFPMIKLVRKSGRYLYSIDELMLKLMAAKHRIKINELADYLNDCDIKLIHRSEVDFFFEEDNVLRTLKILQTIRPEKIHVEIWQILLCAHFLDEMSECVRDSLLTAMQEALQELRASDFPAQEKRMRTEHYLENICETENLYAMLRILKIVRAPALEDFQFLLKHFSVNMLQYLVMRLREHRSLNEVNWQFLKNHMRPEDYSPIFCEMDSEEMNQIDLRELAEKAYRRN